MEFGMNMKSPKPSDVVPAPLKRGRRLEFWFPTLGIFLLAIVLVLGLLATSKNNVTWLSPTELAAAGKPGHLRQFKDHIKKFIMPVWRHFQRPPSVVNLRADVFAVPAGMNLPDDLGSPSSTSSNTTRAWVLSPSQLNSFRQSIQTNSGFVPLNSQQVLTLEGMQAQIQMAGLISLPNGSSTTAPLIPVGTIVDIFPKIVSGSVNLIVGASSTSLAGRSPDQFPLIKTNFALACRVTVPSGGALVVEDGNVKNHNGTNYWLVVSPAILDAQGKPLKP
jgi:hypothetical protein